MAALIESSLPVPNRYLVLGSLSMVNENLAWINENLNGTHNDARREARRL